MMLPNYNHHLYDGYVYYNLKYINSYSSKLQCWSIYKSLYIKCLHLIQ